MASAMEITGPIIDVTTTTMSGGTDQYWLLVRDEESGKKYPIYLKVLWYPHIPQRGDRVWVKGKLKTVLSDHSNVKSLIKAGDLEWADDKIAVKATALVGKHMKLLEKVDQDAGDDGFPKPVK